MTGHGRFLLVYPYQLIECARGADVSANVVPKPIVLHVMNATGVMLIVAL